MDRIIQPWLCSSHSRSYFHNIPIILAHTNSDEGIVAGVEQRASQHQLAFIFPITLPALTCLFYLEKLMGMGP